MPEGSSSPKFKIGEARGGLGPAVLGGLLTSLVAFAAIEGWKINTGRPGQFVEQFLNLRAGSVDTSLTWLIIALLAFATVVRIRQCTRVSPSIITISADGITDMRLSPQVIEWAAIKSVTQSDSAQGKAILLHVEPMVLSRMVLREPYAWERSRGSKTLPIHTEGLDISHRKIAKLIDKRYAPPLPSH